ncbi:MAG: hypothetical protein AMS18_17495 [Gemmatimonas sp. SG8_17]|nr:MAG: hypothetical protein AMS18_17495 [Gemmatimonas sp. SG8_17]
MKNQGGRRGYACAHANTASDASLRTYYRPSLIVQSYSGFTQRTNTRTYAAFNVVERYAALGHQLQVGEAIAFPQALRWRQRLCGTHFGARHVRAHGTRLNRRVYHGCAGSEPCTGRCIDDCSHGTDVETVTTASARRNECNLVESPGRAKEALRNEPPLGAFCNFLD